MQYSDRLYELVKWEFYHRTKAYRAMWLCGFSESGRPRNIRLGHFATKSPQQMRRLLRDHNEDGEPTQPEIVLRDAVDNLLQFLGLLEVGCVAGVFRIKDFSLRERVAWESVLSNHAVSTYFGRIYPIELPGRFLLRLQHGEGQPIAPQREIFGFFCELARQLAFDDDLEMFLWLLDGGSYGKYDMELLLGQRGDPEVLRQEGFGQGEEDNAYGWRIARGFTLFMDYVSELKQLLDDAKTLPALELAIWQFNSYWFSSLKSVAFSRLKELAEFLAKLNLGSSKQSRQNLGALEQCLKNVDRIRSAGDLRLPQTMLKPALRAPGNLSRRRSRGQHADDPWKGAFGRSSKRQGTLLRAIGFRPEGEGYYSFTLEVSALPSRDSVQGWVAFYLHPTIPSHIRKVRSINGVARTEVVAFGAFTVGAVTEDGTELELDLADSPDTADWPQRFLRS